MRQEGAMPSIEVRMLGPLSVSRHGTALALPGSRKVRGLLAYLLLSPHPVQRSQLCELLWDVPNDPRGELRWSLSKIRGLVDEPARPRVDARGDTVAVDLSDALVDAIEVARAASDIPALSVERLRSLAAMFAGDFLEGLEIDLSPAFNSWVTAQRRQFRGYRAALLEQLVRIAPDAEVLSHLEQWLVLAPFDQHVHELLLSTSPDMVRSVKVRNISPQLYGCSGRRASTAHRSAMRGGPQRRRLRARHVPRRLFQLKL
jgi:DNA-binding SARP family transcriptional activator